MPVRFVDTWQVEKATEKFFKRRRYEQSGSQKVQIIIFSIGIKAYFAGLLDGEGCVRIGRTKSQNNKHKYDYRAYIQIGMTSEKILKWVKKNIGENYYKATAKTMKSKTSYNWFMNPIEASKILILIMPYLIIKRRHAELFVKYVHNAYHGKPGIKGLDKENVAIRERTYCQMKKLNKKGV